MRAPNDSCMAHGGTVALTSTTIFKICGVMTGSGWLEHHI